MSDYISYIRSKVGNEIIILNFAGACISNEKGELLLQKRSQYEELWGLPGGAIEVGESVAEAAIREVKEETGFEIKLNHLIGVYSKYFTKYPNGDEAQTICHLFDGSIIGGSISLDNQETFDLRFFKSNDIPMLFNQQHKDMVVDYFERKVGVYK